MFVTIIILTMAFNATSYQLIKEDGAYFYPLFYAGVCVGFACLCNLLVQFIPFCEETEDHLYIENTCRTQFLLYYAIMMPLTFLWHWIGLTIEDINVGVEDYPPLHRTGLRWWHFAVCAVYGLTAGLIISLISEYFSS